MKQYILNWWGNLSAQEQADWQSSWVSIASIITVVPAIILAL